MNNNQARRCKSVYILVTFTTFFILMYLTATNLNFFEKTVDELLIFKNIPGLIQFILSSINEQRAPIIYQGAEKYLSELNMPIEFVLLSTSHAAQCQ